MPEMHFLVEWPNGETQRCYSPSYVVEEHLSVGQEYAVPDFVERVARALHIASERVRARYGFACSSALDQLSIVEASASALRPAEREGRVKVLSFEKHAARDARATPPGSVAKSHHAVVVIGGGQAGLSVSHCLKQQGIEHVVLERTRIASSWRTQRWDTFCLVTPNWQCNLPGYPYQGSDPKGFMGRDEIVAYLEAYRASFEPPVREGVEVRSVEPRGRPLPGFDLETSIGPMSADQVVVATGSYHLPAIPSIAAELASDIVQIHSADYRNPQSLPQGEVLVVGTGQSGCQIAEDLHLAGRRVHLSVGSAPRCARRHRGRDVVEWLDMMGYYDIPIDRHPNREQVRDKTNHYVTGRDGGHDIDLRKFALEGMRLYGPLRSISADCAEFATGLKRNLDEADGVYRSINRTIDAFIDKAGIDAPKGAEYVPVWEPESEPPTLNCRTANIRAVVWCVGFAADFSWVKAPVFDETRYPRHQRGITEVEGLYFIGLPWLYTWGSGRFCGVGQDAGQIVQRIHELREGASSLPAADFGPPDTAAHGGV
jgi:putative flavoprotein involved in K+ transport